MARALAAMGAGDQHECHLVTSAPKAAVLAASLAGGFMSRLVHSATSEGVVTWTEESSGLHLHVSLVDEQEEPAAAGSSSEAAGAGASGGGRSGMHASMAQQQQALPPVVRRMLAEAAAIMRAPGSCHSQQGAWVVLDADASQAPCKPSSSSSSSASRSTGAPSLLEAAVAAFTPRSVLLLVQNLHFTPIGPLGTQPRRPTLLSAWRQLGGVLAVSQYVGDYLQQHAPPGTPQPHAVRMNAWCAFGEPPFPDFGAAVAPRLAAADGGGGSAAADGGGGSAASGGAGGGCSDGQGSGGSSAAAAALGAPPSSRGGSSSAAALTAAACCSGHSSAAAPSVPVVGALKLTPEKGAALFLSLAARLPHLSFQAVCADAGVAAAAAQLPNVKLLQPQSNIDSVLGDMWLVLAPSLWCEAFGMAVVEAMLRGLPVVVSQQGGLPEACRGAGVIAPVAAMSLPVDPTTSCPSWRQRHLPTEQPVEAWAAAVEQLLASREAYTAASRAARAAALAFVEDGGRERERFLQYLAQQQEQQQEQQQAQQAAPSK